MEPTRSILTSILTHTSKLVHSALITLVGCGWLATGCEGVPEDELIPVETESMALSGQTNPGPNQVLVCPDINMGGNCALVSGDHPYDSGVPNDSMSSMKVGIDVRVMLCRDSGYSGTCFTFPPGYWYYRLSDTTIGNDSVSSLRVIPASTPNCHNGEDPPAGWVFLYRDALFGGECTAVSYGGYWSVVDAGLPNDSVSSVKVGSGTMLTMYQHVGFGGITARMWGASIREYLSHILFNDSLSSLIVTTY